MTSEVIGSLSSTGTILSRPERWGWDSRRETCDIKRESFISFQLRERQKHDDTKPAFF